MKTYSKVVIKYFFNKLNWVKVFKYAEYAEWPGIYKECYGKYLKSIGQVLRIYWEGTGWSTEEVPGKY